MKILCVMGRHLYGKAALGDGVEYLAFIPALKRLGHTVVHFESWDRTGITSLAQINEGLLQCVKSERPDVLLAVQTDYELWTETLDLIRHAGEVATICWTTDDSWKFAQFSRFVGKHYHAMTTTYDAMVPLYKKAGIPNVLLTQWAARKEALAEPLPSSQCKYPVSFVGAAHGNRKERVQWLRSQGIKVDCFGHGWDSGPVSTEDMMRIVRESVISLNFSNAQGDNQIKARTFEVPGAGGFLLTEQAAGLERFYDLNRELQVFVSMDELVAKIRHFLGAPAERDMIARAGYERTLRDHTYDQRVKDVIAFAGTARKACQADPKSDPVAPLSEAIAKHDLRWVHRAFRNTLLFMTTLIWGKVRGPRAARRILFELSWRLAGASTYSAAGWPGRLFPKD